MMLVTYIELIDENNVVQKTVNANNYGNNNSYQQLVLDIKNSLELRNLKIIMSGSGAISKYVM